MNMLIALVAGLAASLACFALVAWRNPRYIALWQILGGALIIAAWVAAWMQGLDPYSHAVMAASSLVVAAVAIAGGILLSRSRPLGITVSIIAQVLQVAWISLPRAQLGATLGPTIGPRFTPGSVSLNVGFYGRGGFMVFPESVIGFDVTINLLAVMAILVLFRLRGQLRGTVREPETAPESQLPHRAA